MQSKILVLVSWMTLVAGDVPVTFSVVWASAEKGSFCVPVARDLHGWRIHLMSSDSITRLDITEASVVTTLNNGREFILENKSWNADEHVGDTICVDFLANTDHRLGVLTGHAYLEGFKRDHSTHLPLTDTVSLSSTPATVRSTHGAANTSGTAGKYDYKEVLGLSILFYDAQRSGKLPANNHVSWRADSSLTDKGDNGEDLTGGWYDAGDMIKFNLPMASATTILSWGFLKWSDAYKTAGQEDHMYDMIKWPLDYFLKCWNPVKKEYYVQVGESSLDSTFWGRPEDLPANLKVFKVTASKPGSDVAGITAAALAAGSVLYQTKDASYGARLLSAAESLYAFATTYRGIYSVSVPAAASAYASTGYNDELCVAAVWLYKATRDKKYLEDAKTYHSSASPWAYSWDDTTVGCQLMLYDMTRDVTYRTEVQRFLTSWKPGGSLPYTPCGMAFRSKWGSLRYDANVAFIALMAAEDGIDQVENRQWALSQLNYILGDNKQHLSFVVGFGSKYPLQPRHGASSCPDQPATCDWSNFHSPGPNPHVLKGALVGGPDGTDTYSDKRSDYVGNEVAVDYNAGFQSTIAGLVHLSTTRWSTCQSYSQVLDFLLKPLM
uniref:Endoglucanase n=1 Tax=Haliotis discus discus TaxID=91233 RepID=B6RB07_HALDI|nr:endo 1,4- beta D- glucanase 2 [Haliotis discus discus]